MLRDVFYYGKKPNVHPREKFANNLDDARSQATTEHFWIINEFCDYSGFDWEFDFEFLPDEDVWAQDHNNVWPSQHQKDSGTWLCPKVNSEIIIYRVDVAPIKRKNEISSSWKIIENVDTARVDFSWSPDPTDPPYIYVWGCKYFPVELKPCLEYHVPGATRKKYMREIVLLLPEWDKWYIPENIDKNSFDFAWRPNPLDSPDPYIYQFGTQWQKTGGPRYTVEGATQIKYITLPKAKAVPSEKNWIIPDNIDVSSFDFSWHPDDTEEPYIHQFRTQWQRTGGPRYIVENATQTKYIDYPNAKTLSNKDNWIIPDNIDQSLFDFSWHPDEDEEPYIYQFGTQWQKTGGPKYIPADATKDSAIKYIEINKATAIPDNTNWIIPDNIDVSSFDFSWHPDDTDPPYIYQFGSLMDNNDGPRYVVPNNNGEIIYKPRIYKKSGTDAVVDLSVINVNKYYIETTLSDLINKHPTEVFWAIRKNIDYNNFNFDWRPDIIEVAWESTYVSVFGSPESETTQTYFVNAKSFLNGNVDFKFIEEKRIDESYLSQLFVKPDMFFIDRGNIESQERFEKLKSVFGNIQKTRYLNNWVDTINRCISKCTTELCWILNSELDYTNFDFNYYPNPWQMKMVHVFGTQWSHWGTTFLINCESFPNDTKYIKIIEHLSNINFVKQRRTNANLCIYDIYVIDHGNKETESIVELLKTKSSGKNVTTIAYQDNYLTTFKNLLITLPDRKEHFIWVCSSICNYLNFDFSYICDPYAKEQLHTFPSDNQKFGDTFLVNVNRLRELLDSMTVLENYNKINFNHHQKVPRLPPPVFITDDTHTSSLKDDYDFPYAIYLTNDNQQLATVKDVEPLSMWDNDKNILITSIGGTRIVAPKEAKPYVKTELYDYPFIKTSNKLSMSNPLDIVFFSNGEVGADENYKHLLSLTKNLRNRVIRIDKISGRVASQHAAANASKTPWYFLVNAKLTVNKKFDFNWQPDRLQIPKHYIFLATNLVNGLEYGHQAIVANNKTLTLNTMVKGLDFTMDSEHEVVNINSGIGVYNTSPWDTWRTAFREVIKLKHSATAENKQRLEVWLSKAEGDFAEYSLYGAKDAVEYYEQVNGKIEELKLSYEWDWLKEIFSKKY